MKTSEDISEIAAALAKTQSELKEVHKGKTAVVRSEKGQFKYGYADIADVLKSARPVCAANDIAITQGVEGGEGMWNMTTMLLHKSGQWIRSDTPFHIESGGRMSQSQAMGSAITYVRRYALSAILGIASDDDVDGIDGMDAPERGAEVRTPKGTYLGKSTGRAPQSAHKTALDNGAIEHADDIRDYASTLKAALYNGANDTVAEILDSVAAHEDHNVKPNVWKLLSKAEQAQISAMFDEEKK